MGQIKRPSGQSDAWNQGFNWATDQGDYYHLDCADAMEKLGYDICAEHDKQCEDFERGVEYAQAAQMRIMEGDEDDA